MKPKHLHDRDPWMLAENIPDCDLFFSQIFMSSFTNDTSYRFLKNYKKVIATFQGFAMNFYFGKEDSFAVGESILAALLERPRFGPEMNRQIVARSGRLVAFTKRAARLPLARFSNRELRQLYDEHDHLHTKLYTYGWLPVAVDMFHNNFTNYLKGRLRRVCGDESAVNEAFVLLTTPLRKSIIAAEREEFLLMCREARTFLRRRRGRKVAPRDLPPALQQRLGRHQARWGHFGYTFSGHVEPFSVQHYLDEMTDLYKTRVQASPLLKREAAKLREARQKQEAFCRKARLPAPDRRLFHIAREFALTKLVRRHAQLQNILLLHRYLLPEIARRLYITHQQVQFMLPREIREALVHRRVDESLLSERLRRCVYYTERGFEAVYVGARAGSLARTLDRLLKTDASELQGQTAEHGYAKGKVKVIIRASDMKKMRPGDILVSIATDPDIVPAMKKAGAIVTEQGGITSHAAIVSRELGKPCIIGTKIATKIFKDGDLVEVDATRGVIRKVR